MEIHILFVVALVFILSGLHFDYKHEYQYRNCKRKRKGCRNWMCKANAICQYSAYQLKKGDKLPTIYNLADRDGTLFCPVCFKFMRKNGRLFWRRGKAYMICADCKDISDDRLRRMYRKGDLLTSRVGHYDYL